MAPKRSSRKLVSVKKKVVEKTVKVTVTAGNGEPKVTETESLENEQQREELTFSIPVEEEDFAVKPNDAAGIEIPVEGQELLSPEPPPPQTPGAKAEDRMNLATEEDEEEDTHEEGSQEIAGNVAGGGIQKKEQGQRKKRETQKIEEREKAKKKVKGEKKSSSAEDSAAKKRRRKRFSGDGEGYKRYVFKVMKQVHPDMAISGKGMSVLNAFMGDMFERLAEEAARLSMHTRRRTLSSREVQAAVRLVLPGELSRHAIAEGSKAVSNYVAYDSKKR